MDKEDLKVLREIFAFDRYQMADFCGVTFRTYLYWEQGSHKIPKPVKKFLRLMADPDVRALALKQAAEEAA